MPKIQSEKKVKEIIITKKDREKVVKELIKHPLKDKGDAMPRFQIYSKNYIHQADLLELPWDDLGVKPTENGKVKPYRYALVVADVGTRLVDARALQEKKAETILKAFKEIYKGGILKRPQKLEVDGGGEFKGDTKKYFEKEGVPIREAKPNRHRQQGIVETKNQILGTKLTVKMAGEELGSGITNRVWVKHLKSVIKKMNATTKKRFKQNLKEVRKNEDKFIVGEEEVLDEGTKVLVANDVPMNSIDDKKETGDYRQGDFKWNTTPRTIKMALVRPAMPVLYMLDGKKGTHKVEPVAYTRNRLKVFGDDKKKLQILEDFTTKKKVNKELEKEKAKKTKKDEESVKPKNGEEDLWIVEKVLDKQMKPVILKSGKEGTKKEWHYLVKWKGFSSKKNSWEPLINFNEEGRKYIQEYEDSINGSKKKVVVKETPKKRNTKKVEKEPSKDIYKKVYNTRSRRGRNE